MSHDDDRGGVPSGSAMERAAYCPSSFNFESRFPDSSSKIAREGEFLHDVVMDFKPLTDAAPDQQSVIARAIMQREEVIGITIGEWKDRKREERLWLHNDLKPVLSARYDDLFINGSEALLIDYKFGYKDVPHAKGNLQLRAQAVMIYEKYGTTDMYCAIVSPRCGEPTVVKYSESELSVSAQSIRDLSSTAIETKDLSKLKAGRWCDYCKARHACPEAWSLAF